MRKRLFLLVLMSVLAALPAVAAAADQTGEAPLPEAFFPERIWNFDSVLEGAEVVHDFVVKNTGSAPLEILGVKTG